MSNAEDRAFELLAIAEKGVVSGNGKYSTLRIFTPTSFNDIQHGIFA